MVAMARAGFRTHGCNQDVVAVISFYLLSAYAMTMLIGISPSFNLALLLLASFVLALGSFCFAERPAPRWRHAGRRQAKAGAT